MARILFDQNTGMIELLGLKDVITDTFITSATVNGQIDDADGTTVFGPSVMASVGASVTREIDGVSQTFTSGNYRVIVPETTNYTLKSNGKFQRHTVIITADDGTNRDARWEQEIPITTRDFSE